VFAVVGGSAEPAPRAHDTVSGPVIYFTATGA
jgi:hypothetical protein